MKLFFNKILLAIVIFSYCYSTEVKATSRIAIIGPKANLLKINKLKRIMTHKLYLPKGLIKISYQKSCVVKKDYDIVICVSEDGKITFPIYKKDILKNTYQVFIK